MIDHLVDPTGNLVAELKALGIASGRVRGAEPRGQSADYEGDALGPGKYKRFVVLVRLVPQRITRLPVARFQYVFRAYGVTPQDAAALYGEVSDALHLVGPRVGLSGIAIYQSVQEFGNGADKDPDTNQPYESGLLEVMAGMRLVAAGS